MTVLQEIAKAYQLVLHRPLDKGGTLTWMEIIQKGEYSKRHLVNTLLASYEYLYKTPRAGRLSQFLRLKSILKLVSSEITNSAEEAHLVYRFLLYRDIDTGTLESIKNRLSNGSLSINKLIYQILRSTEYQNPLRQPATSSQLHMARIKWVKSLPAAKRILDIGGSSPTMAEGALIELGYMHRPEQLIIFDKPPSEQFWGKPNYSQDQDQILKWGAIHYMHGYAEDILNHAELQHQQFDMVFMGQVVEHIYQNKLHDVLVWIKQHLTETGILLFDTPNRALTLFETGPDHYIDPDHKKEYTPNDMKIILQAAGFEVTQQWGIVDMPLSLSSQSFDSRDFHQSPLLTSEPATAYCFAMACKPKN